ncbi:uncharacterized protein LOC143209642 isoform X2 [Lasioglossum baleicum]|uniref:uncharacterized protein LOC143209642 isoform X2 n=1 Tax=Lasioglossum baleicum TaxID=434251 RepID=UPI003FCDB0B6
MHTLAGGRPSVLMIAASQTAGGGCEASAEDAQHLRVHLPTVSSRRTRVTPISSHRTTATRKPCIPKDLALCYAMLPLLLLLQCYGDSCGRTLNDLATMVTHDVFLFGF